ncbi:MAG: hypothetical protein ABNH33_03855, partial [Glaciecola sp.]
NEDVPKFMGAKKMSLHQTGFQEVLATAELLGDYPDKVFLIGVQPEELEDYGGSLRDITKAQIQPCLDIAIDYLNNLGVNLITREIPSENANNQKLTVNSFENDTAMRNQLAGYSDVHHAVNNHQPHIGYHVVNHPSLTIEEYEQSRPSAQSACRVGDERVLLDSNIRFEPKTFEESPESLSPNMAVKLGQRLKG